MDSALQLRAPARYGGLRRLACVALLLALALASGGLVGPVDLALAGRGEFAALVVIAASIAYVVAMALPFVPGIEIGMAVMLVLGWDGILLIYLCTQAAFALSFGVGRWVPEHAIAAAFRWLGMTRAQCMVEELERTAPACRVELLARRTTAPWLAALLRHRHLALAVALNLPGNAILGGAGGIGLIAGLSRAYRFPLYALVVAAATTPVPLFLLLKGIA